MSTLYISEFANMAGVGSRLVNVAPMSPLAEQTVAIGASSVQSNAFSANTRVIRVAADLVCSIAIGSSPTATATKARIPANVPEYFAVRRREARWRPEGLAAPTLAPWLSSAVLYSQIADLITEKRPLKAAGFVWCGCGRPIKRLSPALERLCLPDL